MHARSRPVSASSSALCPTFFVRASATRELPRGASLERELQRWIIAKLSGWLQLAVLERVREGLVEWSPQLPEDGRAGSLQLICVRCHDQIGPRRPGLWAALSVAHAFADLLDGAVLDARQSEVIFGARAWTRPPADGRVHVLHHLRIPSSSSGSSFSGSSFSGSSSSPLRVGRSQWMTTAGMAHFGLPDLELEGLGLAATSRGAALMLGVAQHMIDASWRAPDRGAGAGELILELGELHWALGGQPHSRPLSSGRGWTRLALEASKARTWPHLLRLGPPLGTRTWQSTSAWIDAAWRDLFGRVAGKCNGHGAHQKSSHFSFAPPEFVDY